MVLPACGEVGGFKWESAIKAVQDGKADAVVFGKWV
jgi:hypothetical protein